MVGGLTSSEDSTKWRRRGCRFCWWRAAVASSEGPTCGTAKDRVYLSAVRDETPW